MRVHQVETSQPNRTIDEFPRYGLEEMPDWSERTEVFAVPLKAATQPGEANQELARDLGYETVREMMEQTEIVPLPSGSFMYLTADADNFWVAWREKPHGDIQRFESRREAIATLRENDDWVMIGS